MAGVFKIHPTNKSTIICDALDVERSTAYLLVIGEFNETEREKVLYSEGRLDGSVIWSESSLVDIELTMLIGGTTVEDAAQNMAVIQNAFSSGDGGYLEYRPIGFGTSIETTWYKYLKSAPPVQIDAEKVHQNLTPAYTFSNLYSFKVKIFALATSEPTVLQDIASGTIESFDGSPAYLTIPESSIKGDGIFPYIYWYLGTVSPYELILHIMRIESAGDGKDFYGNSPPPAKPVYVDYDGTDRFHTAAAQTSWYLAFHVQDDTRMLFGKSSPQMPYFIHPATGGDWEVRLTGTYLANLTPQVLTDWEELTTKSASNWSLHIFDTINVPPLPFPSTMDLTPTNMDMDITVNVREKNGTPGYIKIFGLLLSPIGRDGDWIARFSSPDPVLDTGSYFIDAVDGIHFKGVGPTHPWIKSGMAIREAIMPKGRYQMRAIFPGTSGYYGVGTTNIDLDGIYYTIYPFSE